MNEIALTSPQRQFHNALLEHECAPRFNFTSTDMLTNESLKVVRQFQADGAIGRFWSPTSGAAYPDWLNDFVDQAVRTVPYYRSYGKAPKTFEAIPPFGREVVQSEPWRLVPDHLSLEALTVYTTSGTTGTALRIPTDPTVSSMLLILLDRLLSSKGVELPRGVGKVAIALVACQQETLTYASLSHTLDGAGFLKLNLAPHAWRDAAHRARYLEEAAPAVITGSPYAFEVLSQVAPALRPRALVSAAVTLHDGHAAALQSHFGCPVFDLYSMTEARGIAGRSSDQSDLALLSTDLYVEILGPEDEPLPEGEVGEVVLTGGRNPYFPLLRYRTGDRAALLFKNGQPHLSRFEGRHAVHLENKDGEPVPTLDVVHALKDLALIGFSLNQSADRSLHFDYCGSAKAGEVQGRLEALFGGKVSVGQKSGWEGKPHRFSSAVVARPG
jgi:phenylacetate-CoA ligase